MNNSQQQSKLVEYAKKLRCMKDKKEALKSELEDLNKELDTFNKEFVELMELNQLKKFTVDGIGTCYISADIYPKVNSVELLHEDLRLHGAGALIKEVVNHQSLKAYCKECLEAKNELPKGVDVYPEAQVVIRKK